MADHSRQRTEHEQRPGEVDVSESGDILERRK